MKPTFKTYRIQTINDLFAVPADRREACLLELLEGIETAERCAEDVRKRCAAITFPRGLRWLQNWSLRRIKPSITRLDWVDDGQFTAHITMRGPGGDVSATSPDWRNQPIAGEDFSRG